MTNERRISSEILVEMIKVFNGLTIQSTINNSAYCNSEKDDAESDPNSDPNVDTHTSYGKKIKVTDNEDTNRNSPRKLLINWLIPDIIPVEILPIDQTIAEDAAGCVDTLHAYHTILSTEIVMDGARSAAHFSGLLQMQYGMAQTGPYHMRATLP